MTNTIDEDLGLRDRIGAYFAECARDALLERTRLGSEIAASQGRLLHAGYGYRREGRDVVIDDGQAARLRSIYEAAANGVSADAIARALPADAAPTRRGWSARAVKAIVANPRHCGVIVWRRTRSRVDQESGKRVVVGATPDEMIVAQRPDLAIVSPELFASALKALGGMPTRRGTTKRRSTTPRRRARDSGLRRPLPNRMEGVPRGIVQIAKNDPGQIRSQESLRSRMGVDATSTARNPSMTNAKKPPVHFEEGDVPRTKNTGKSMPVTPASEASAPRESAMEAGGGPTTETEARGAPVHLVGYSRYSTAGLPETAHRRQPQRSTTYARSMGWCDGEVRSDE